MTHEEQKLLDQYVTVRVLVRVVVAMAVIATAAASVLWHEIDSSSDFQVEQRIRLWDRVNQLQGEIQVLKSDVGEIRSDVKNIGKTADAILEVVIRRAAEPSPSSAP